MTSQQTDLLVFTAIGGLIVVSLYAMWLWIRLWVISQLIDRLRALIGDNDHNASQSNSGCGGFLFLLLVIGIVLIFLFATT